MEKRELEVWPTMTGCFIHDLNDEGFKMGPFKTGHEAYKAMEKLITEDEVYPVMKQLALDLQPVEIPEWIKETAVTTVGEYEHGTADVETLGCTLEQYAAVTLDFLLTLSFTQDEK